MCCFCQAQDIGASLVQRRFANVLWLKIKRAYQHILISNSYESRFKKFYLSSDYNPNVSNDFEENLKLS
jgi:hypothetical protein